MPVPLFHVDAFTDRPFTGNPAAVCPLPSWPHDDLLRSIAAENNLSETAFFVAEKDHFRLRWFTPQCEVNLCGHATLASAFILFTILHPKRVSVRFETLSGTLLVAREGEFMVMDFPVLPAWTCENPPRALLLGLRLETLPKTALVKQLKDNYFVIFEREDEVQTLRPDFRELEKLHPAGVAISAPGKTADFVSRYFAPSYGIPEDPVTGSTHCSLAPYWAQRLGKKKLYARQVSKRGGEMWCEVAGDRVIIRGKAVLTLEGSLLIE
ncbi:MAG TPA: PhzF family phenazine biosynthesis protein [Candidatus Sulfotelmatobacter sp.]